MESAQTLPGERISSFELVQPAENVSAEMSEDKWELKPYNTIYGGGIMLACRPGFHPGPVTFRLPQKGWHRIYVCLIASSFPSPIISLKLKNDLGSSFFCKNLPNPNIPHWRYDELAEEYYWECADLTDEELTIEKLHDSSPNMIGLLWLRCVPMTEKDVAAHHAESARRDVKRLHAHTDLDWIGKLNNITPDMFAPFVQSMADSDAELLSVEFYPLLMNSDFLDKYSDAQKERLFDRRILQLPELKRQQKEIYTYLTSKCHERKMRVYAALRHSISVNPFPIDSTSPISHVDFAEQHPEFHCIDRDGEHLTMISFAFREPQDYIIGEFLKMMEYGFDGVTLFFHRGVFTLFEQPVLDLCAQLYDGLDARRLPLNDERLVNVHCELMTRFMRRLRTALDEYSQSHGLDRLGICVIGCYTLQDNRRIGVDVRRWTEEKLIDSCVVANMKCWEEDEPLMADDQPGLLDTDKYREAKYHAVARPVRRHYFGGIEMMLSGLQEYMELSRQTGLPVYFDVPWECTREPEYFREYAMRLYEAGAEHISLWDCFHTRVMNRAEWNVVSRLGHINELPATSDDRETYGRTVRIVSIGNVSIACFHPAWRG